MADPVKIFIDSGAFSAWRLGRPVDVVAYSDFLVENQDWIDVAAALDVIIPDDPEEAARLSFENLLYMRSRGLDPVPVWHVRESTSWIQRILDVGCMYVGLSATSCVSSSATQDWYEMAWSYVVDRGGAPLAKVHSFGESRLEVLRRYPWASADSSTWLEGEKRGTLILPDGTWMAHTKSGESSRARQDIEFLEGEDLIAFDELVEGLGISKAAFADRASREARAARSVVTAARFREIQRDVRSMQPIRFRPTGGLITRSRPPERRSHDFPDQFDLYLAAGTNNMALPCAHSLGLRNLLVSYFYLRPTLTSILREYKKDPEAVMSNPPYAKYTELLKKVLTHASHDAPDPAVPILAAG